MVDLAKRLRKHAGSSLEPGEDFVAALSVAPPGLTANSARPIGGGAIGVITATRAARRDADAAPDERITVPAAGFLLGLTDRRLLVFAQTLAGKPKELVAAWPRPDVTVTTVDTKAGPLGRARTYTIAAASGPTLVVEANVSGPARRLADRFDGAWADGPAPPR